MQFCKNNNKTTLVLSAQYFVTKTYKHNVHLNKIIFEASSLNTIAPRFTSSRRVVQPGLFHITSEMTKVYHRLEQCRFR